MEDLGQEGAAEAPGTIAKKPWKISPEDEVRRILAIGTLVGFFVELLFPLILLGAGRINEDATADLEKTLGSITAGLVGAVWGFYFSTKKGS